MSEAVEEVANQVLGPTYDLPVDLHHLARTLHVTVRKHAPIDVLGETRRVPNGYEVALRDGQSPQRWRFTFAHELAHVLLDGSKRMLLPTANLEHLCDRIAGAILMPRADVRSRIMKRTAAELICIAADFNVSLHAAAARFALFTGASVFRASPATSTAPVAVVQLAGVLSHGDSNVRRTIADALPECRPTIASTQHGNAHHLWDVEFAPLRKGDILCIFLRREVLLR